MPKPGRQLSISAKPAQSICATGWTGKQDIFLYTRAPQELSIVTCLFSGQRSLKVPLPQLQDTFVLMTSALARYGGSFTQFRIPASMGMTPGRPMRGNGVVVPTRGVA